MSKRIVKRGSDKVTAEELFAYVRGLNLPGVRCGYIGNVERWGDDRNLRIWAGDVVLWSHDAATLTRADVSRAYAAFKVYRLGFVAGYTLRADDEREAERMTPADAGSRAVQTCCDCGGRADEPADGGGCTCDPNRKLYARPKMSLQERLERFGDRD